MNVKHQVTRVMTVQTVTLKIEGAADWHRWSTYQGMPVRPEQLTVTYVNGVRSSVMLAGPLVTKTGKPRKDSWVSESASSRPPDWVACCSRSWTRCTPRNTSWSPSRS